MALPALVSAYQAQSHLRANNEDLVDVQFKLEQASDIVWDYLKLKSVPDDWIMNTSPLTYAIPRKIQAITLLVLGELYENRESTVSNPLSEGVQALCERLRDPGYA